MTATRTLLIAATLSSLDSVAEYAAELAAQAGFAESDAYRLRLVLDELFTNIATHGRDGPASRDEVEVTGTACDGEVVLTVADWCRPFDPRCHSAAEPPADAAAEPGADAAAEPGADSAAEPPADSAAEPPADSAAEPPADAGYRLGGYGLILLRQLADSVDYQRTGCQNRTTIVLRQAGRSTVDGGGVGPA
jgi:anti-sigma regulatory factor (Ser/Thr protein kinase)